MNPAFPRLFSRRPACLIPLLLLVIGGVSSRAAERLEGAASSFLRAHANNPVNWMPWGDEAFDRAANEGRPVFLVVGAAHSELSAAMNRQTFSNPEVAAFLNDHFVCVLVDRDERPEVAAQGQAYVRAVKQLSGWPLNLFLTPDLLPIEGATYLPPSEEWGKEGFLNVAKRVAGAWQNDPEFAREDARLALDTVKEFEATVRAGAFRVGEVRTSLEGSAAAWISQSDAEHGGFGESPRHPEPEMLRFLLRANAPTRRAAAANLRGVLASALRDPVDGGFFRYTTDAQARLPYFQKRLADQARMVLALLDAQALEPDPQFAAAARAAVDYALNRLGRPGGGFAAGEDSTGKATQFHVWTYDELRQLLRGDATAFATAHGATPDGNVSRDDDPSNALLGANILAGTPDPRWTDALATLRVARDQRAGPALDDNRVAMDQGLFLLALARAGRELSEPRYTAAAGELVRFIRGELLLAGGGLRRLAGSDAPAGPADAAALALGLRALETSESRALADELLRWSDRRHLDPANGCLYTTPAELPRGLWLRLPAPFSTPGDSPAAAPLRLIAGEPFVESIAALLATQHRDPALAASGDLLLALRLHVDRLP